MIDWVGNILVRLRNGDVIVPTTTVEMLEVLTLNKTKKMIVIVIFYLTL